MYLGELLSSTWWFSRFIKVSILNVVAYFKHIQILSVYCSVLLDNKTDVEQDLIPNG